MTINGLSVLVTDLLLAGFTVWLAWALFQQWRRLKDHAIALWLGAFCAVAAAAVLGGVWYTFASRLDEEWAPLLRTVTMVLATGAGLLFLLGILHGYTAGRVRAVLAAVVVAKFALFALWIAVNDNFGLVIYDSVVSMFVIIVLCSWGAWAHRTSSAPWVLAGVAVSMLGALFQQGRVSIHPHFNHNDLYHAIQMGAMYLLYRGGTLLRDLEPDAVDFEATQPLPIIGEE